VLLATAEGLLGSGGRRAHGRENSLSGSLLAVSFEKVSEAERLAARLMREEDSQRFEATFRCLWGGGVTAEGLLGSGAR
jgi:hypothetical protein